MKLYTNTTPFAFAWVDGKPDFLPIGTTFAVIGADICGVVIEQVSELNKAASELAYQSINPSVFNLVFKEVEQLNKK